MTGHHQVDSLSVILPHYCLSVHVQQKSHRNMKENTQSILPLYKNTERNSESKSSSCKTECLCIIHKTKKKRACLKWETCFVCLFFSPVLQYIKIACEPIPCESRFSTRVFLKLQVTSKTFIQKMHCIYYLHSQCNKNI